MGKLTYNGMVKVDFEDRALAHLQMVISSKLRRGEAFTLSWKDDVSVGDGRTTIWIHPACNLVYKYYGSRRPNLNPAWVDALAFTANSSSGLYLVPEPEHASGRSDVDGLVTAEL